MFPLIMRDHTMYSRLVCNSLVASAVWETEYTGVTGQVQPVVIYPPPHGHSVQPKTVNDNDIPLCLSLSHVHSPAVA